MRHLAFGRLFGLSLAASSLGVAVFAGWLSYRRSCDYEAWVTARPLETPMDLSHPGSITVPFHQTCVISHGEYLMLDCDRGGRAEGTLEELLRGLSGSLVIEDQAGKEVVNQSLWVQQPADILEREIVLTDLPSFPEGEYQATISIKRGVPALAGTPQIVFAKYQLCGLERLAVPVFGFISFCATVVCLIAGLFAIPGFRRDGIWKTRS